jgi:membrane associated rhomboid family serine protease
MNIASEPVSTLIFFITVLSSFYALYIKPTIINKFALDPYSIAQGKKISTILFSGFLHSNLAHLLFNMFSFYFFAFPLEKIIGSSNFFILYFSTLIISNIPTIIKEKNNYYYRAIGASGAISGVIFSFIIFEPTMGILIFPIPFPLPAFIFGILYLTWSYFAAKQNQDMINHDAHFWGAISGILITIILKPSSINYFLGNF